MDHTVYQDHHARMSTLFLTQAAFEINPVMEHLFFDKLLKSLNDVVGTLGMAGTADTNA
jgi:hypothetical protein